MLSELKLALFNLLLHPNVATDALKSSPDAVPVVLIVGGGAVLGYILWDNWKHKG